ncbi:hypothetical protein AVEN_19624-1 [Araneus ventricosus]|uniref:Uncharacterized protein n=1 Tax=Araneus ventricosus TaxID=182803 RepID=A0A4Y2TE00_ARAVE|nr:hypothetical protein AVEN_19624-1 [Araneus ventricosus]
MYSKQNRNKNYKQIWSGRGNGKTRETLIQQINESRIRIELEFKVEGSKRQREYQDVKNLHRLQSLAEELKNVLKNETFELVDRPATEDYIGGRLVLTNKYSPDGSLLKTRPDL